MPVPFDADEVEKVLYKHKDRIARIAFHYLKNWSDAEDMVQDVMLKWIQKKPSFETDEHEKAWFIRITINSCKDKLRSFWYRKIDLSGGTVVFPDTMSEEESQFMEIVLSLPAKQRLVVLLHYYEGYSLNEIAELLHRSPNTVQTWNKQAKTSLRKMMGVTSFEKTTD